jgi:hypothetical protein
MRFADKKSMKLLLAFSLLLLAGCAGVAVSDHDGPFWYQRRIFPAELYYCVPNKGESSAFPICYPATMLSPDELEDLANGKTLKKHGKEGLF